MFYGLLCLNFSHLHCIWGLICFAGCVSLPKFELVLPTLCPWDPSSTSTSLKPRICGGVPPHPWRASLHTHPRSSCCLHTWPSNLCPEPFVLPFRQANTHTPSCPHLTCLLLREALLAMPLPGLERCRQCSHGSVTISTAPSAGCFAPLPPATPSTL